MKNRTLSLADYGIILGSFVVIIAPAVALINSRFTSIDTRLEAMNQSLTQIQVSIAEVSSSLSLVPSPVVSVFWVAFDASDSPFSEYSAGVENWQGVFPEIAVEWASEANFRSVQFLPINSIQDVNVASEFNYFAAFAPDDSALARGLTTEGWSPVTVDQYFVDAGFDPFGYSIFISPRSVTAGYLQHLVSSLDGLPDEVWVNWGTILQAGTSP